jgi:hypothetical protein
MIEVNPFFLRETAKLLSGVAFLKFLWHTKKLTRGIAM